MVLSRLKERLHDEAIAWQSSCVLQLLSQELAAMLYCGSSKDWDEYLQKRLGKVTSVPPSLVVIKETIESPTDLGLSDSGKGQASPAIEGFTPIVLALPVVVGPTLSSVQEGTDIVPTNRGFNPFILPKPT